MIKGVSTRSLLRITDIHARLTIMFMKYTSKLIIKETAKEFNLAIRQYIESLPSSVKLISCDHSVAFKTVATNNDALFSCLIVTAKVVDHIS